MHLYPLYLLDAAREVLLQKFKNIFLSNNLFTVKRFTEK